MADTVTIKKITDLPENTDANDADLFMQGVNGTASLRKIKWSTILAKIKSKLLANNLTTTQEGYALDARQGKALSDQINALNTKTNRILVDRPLITQSPLNGSTIGVYAERVVTGLQNFAEVRMLVAVGDAALQWLTFDTYQATQTVTAYYSERYTASAEFKCDLSSGSIGVKVRSATGWTANQCGIRIVIGVLMKN